MIAYKYSCSISVNVVCVYMCICTHDPRHDGVRPSVFCGPVWPWNYESSRLCLRSAETVGKALCSVRVSVCTRYYVIHMSLLLIFIYMCLLGLLFLSANVHFLSITLSDCFCFVCFIFNYVFGSGYVWVRVHVSTHDSTGFLQHWGCRSCA